MQSRKWTNHPNLRLRPLCPAAARGRLQRQVRRAFMVHGSPLLTGELLEWAYAAQSACGERRLAMVTAGRCGARALGLPIA
jgi:hypothetical protein